MSIDRDQITILLCIRIIDKPSLPVGQGPSEG